MKIVSFLLLLLLVSCASARDAAVTSINASAAFALVAESTLESLQRAEQKQAIADAPAEAVARAAVAKVQARYARAWAGYRKLRVSWLAAAAAARAYDAGERLQRAPDIGNVVRLVAALADAESTFAAAAAELQSGGAR